MGLISHCGHDVVFFLGPFVPKRGELGLLTSRSPGHLGRTSLLKLGDVHDDRIGRRRPHGDGCTSHTSFMLHVEVSRMTKIKE